mmetsp:Transcript_4398/g.7459  ORF Transcript_4398/g.7459 Transcript_4398/m.7459 type:complete len:267 (-) Transcript_4398:288-1088(-)
MRMAYVAAHNASQYFLVKGRTAKPFNSLLGETFELVTPKYRLVCEAVCHHPPIVSMNCQGQGWELNKSVQTIIKFTGKQVSVEDIYPTSLTLHPRCLGGKAERYLIYTPKLYIGNLVMGERFIEPNGLVTIRNVDTGEECDMNFKPRSGGYFSKQESESFEAQVKDKFGQRKYVVEGRYTDMIWGYDPNEKRGPKKLLFRAPKRPTDSQKMYNFNQYVLQLNLLSNKLKQKLPPTDARFRQDVRLWEMQDVEGASQEKQRLEENQR